MIRETDGDRFDLIQDTLRAGFPNFDRLNFPPVAAGTLAMTWKDKISSQPFLFTDAADAKQKNEHLGQKQSQFLPT
jgi:predicted ATPase